VDRRLLILTVALGAVFVVLSSVVGFGFDPLLDADGVVARHAFSATASHPGRIDWWKGVSGWGGPPVMRLALVLAGAAMAVFRRWSLASWLVALAAVEGVVAPSAKLVLARPRPSWTSPIIEAGSTSFPSGHATAAASAAAAAVLLARHLGAGRGVTVLAATVGMAVAGVVAASRVFLGVHYLSDVLGGLVLGSLLAVATYCVVTWLVELRRPWKSPEPG
jgi:membrane-associated phospholipid phosphatase